MAENVRIVGRNFNDNLVGFQYTTGSPLFTIGTFEVTTNLTPKTDRTFTLGGFSEPITLDTLNISSDQNTELLTTIYPIFVNFDRTKLTNYAYFGSLREYIRVSIEQIIEKWVASIYVRNIIDGDVKITVLDYTYDSLTDIAFFKVPTSCFQNKFELKYLSTDAVFSASTTSDDYKNLTLYYTRYVIAQNPYSDDPEYKIIGFTGSTDLENDYVYIETEGNAFSGATGSTSTSFHIKPNKLHVEEFFNSLDGLEYYLLNRLNIPRYTAIFKRPIVGTDGTFDLMDERYTWTYNDGYNIDIDTIEYGDYLRRLLQLGQDYDTYKVNLISRFFTARTIKEFDTIDEKADKLLKIYGREFDEIKLFIDSLAWVSRVSYDKVENLPDQLIKNLAKILGWDTLGTVAENDILQFFLGVNNPSVFPGRTRDLTPLEIDIELWRRIVINSAWIWKGKGTRKVLEFLFKFIGAPACLVDFDEHVYLADGVVDYENLKDYLISISGSSVDLEQIPVDENGFLKELPSTSNFYFQSDGGWFKESIEHLGEYDNGQRYVDEYRKYFTLNKVIDDKKAWVYSSGTTAREFDFPMRQTTYTELRSELVLNTKEVTLWLDPASAIECDVYTFYYNSGCYDFTNLPDPYPSNAFNKDVTNMSLLEFINTSYNRLISARNRKTIVSYPTLKMLYLDYLDSLAACGETSRAFTYADMSSFIDFIDQYWLSLVAQLIPATTIWEGGERYRNTIFDQQKHIYERGIDEGSEFQEYQPNPNKAIIQPLIINGGGDSAYTAEIISAPLICGVFEIGNSGEFLYDCRVSGTPVEYICLDKFGNAVPCDGNGVLSPFEYSFQYRCPSCVYRYEELEGDKFGYESEIPAFNNFSLFTRG